MNDVVVHPNQGELISCDQAGSIKLWDLSENVCMLDLVSQINPVSIPAPHIEQAPAGDVPIRSISIASEGSCHVAGNNKVRCALYHIKVCCLAFAF